MFDNIRPYYNTEIQSAFETLLADKTFMQGAQMLMPKEIIEKFKRIYPKISTIDEFQRLFMMPMLEVVLQKKQCEVSFSGKENAAQPSIFISNHRDIIVDPAFLQYFLNGNGFRTSQIAVGNNLAAADFILAFMRLNKSFIVRRHLSAGEQIAAFKELSAYIRHTIAETKESVWIAQREGRAKDSNDFTQASIIKMFALGGEGSFIDNLKMLNICPLSISYEYDCCDFLKVKEMQQQRDNKNFIKSAEDDVLSMKTGFFGYTKRLHYAFTPCINPELNKIEATNLPRNVQVEQIAALIDRQIHSAYKIFPINYYAYDSLNSTSKFSEHYAPNDKNIFEQYFDSQISKIDLENIDKDFCKQKMLEMYSNTLKNKLLAVSD